MATSIIKGENYGTWQNVPNQPSASLFQLRYLVRNGICYLYFYDNGTYQLNGSTWQRVGTLPEGYRPSNVYHDSWANRSGTTGEIYVDTSGDIYINANLSGKTFIALISPMPIA